MTYIDTTKKLNAQRKQVNPEYEVLSWGDKMSDYIADSLLCVVTLFVALVAFLALGSIAKAAPTGRVEACTIWQIQVQKTQAYTSIVVKAFSNSATGVDRLATAKAILDVVKAKTGFDLIDVWLFAPGTEPIRKHLEKSNAIATVAYTSNPGAIIGRDYMWQGSFTDEKTPVEMTDDDRRFSLNPLFDREYLNGSDIKNLKYAGHCPLDNHRFKTNFAHPDLR